MKETTRLIKMVISTLDSIEVKGRDNLDMLLGSINALESVAQILEVESTTEEVNDG